MKRYLVRQEILGQAISISKVQDDIQGHASQIEENAIKLLLTPTTCTTRNHWRTEIANQFIRIRKLDGTKKYPTAEQIYKWIYTEQLPELTDEKYMLQTILNICDIENITLPNDFDLNEFLDALRSRLSDYYKWLADILSKQGVADRKAVINKLMEIF